MLILFNRQIVQALSRVSAFCSTAPRPQVRIPEPTVKLRSVIGNGSLKDAIETPELGEPKELLHPNEGGLGRKL